MTQNKRNERKKTKDFPRGWTVCAYPGLHPVSSHQHCVWRQFRGTEKTSRDYVVKSIQFSNIYLLLQVQHMWLSGLNSFTPRVYPPYYQLFLSWTEEKFWHSVGKWPAFHWIDDELTNPEKRVKPRAAKCSCSTSFHSDLVKCLVTSKVR